LLTQERLKFETQISELSGKHSTLLVNQQHDTKHLENTNLQLQKQLEHEVCKHVNEINSMQTEWSKTEQKLSQELHDAETLADRLRKSFENLKETEAEKPHL